MTTAPLTKYEQELLLTAADALKQMWKAEMCPTTRVLIPHLSMWDDLTELESWVAWNPLHNDHDAYSALSKLRLRVEWATSYVSVGHEDLNIDIVVQIVNNDNNAALRIATTKTLAAIAKKLNQSFRIDNDSSDNTAAKSCPFCGQTPDSTDPDFCFPHEFSENGHIRTWRAGCITASGCGAYVLGNDPESAITRWQTRTPSKENYGTE